MVGAALPHGAQTVLKAIVAGAGIGGLAAAIALRQAGLEVEVLERTGQLREIGAAVVLWPNGTRSLRVLGVEPTWAPIERMQLLRWDGRLLTEPPVSQMARRYGAGMVLVHRAQLQSALLGVLGEGHVRLGAQVVDLQQRADGVEVLLANGERVIGDLLVGADGLRSTVRSRVFGGAPVYRGFTAWRGEVPAGKIDVQRGLGRNWWGPGGEFLSFPLADGRIYWAGTMNAPEGAAAGPGGHRQDVLDRFAGWADPVLEVAQATEPGAILRTDIYDLPPLKSWSQGCVTLLGDAAHPMTPSQGQGACQALEDAVALGRSFQSGGLVSTSFTAYERARRRRANRVVNLSRQVSASIQSESEIFSRFRYLLIRLLPSSTMFRVLDATFGD